MNNSTPFAPTASFPISDEAFEALFIKCLALVEATPEVQAVLRERDNLIRQIDNVVPFVVSDYLSSVAMAVARQFRKQMLHLGIAFGSNPSAILELQADD